MALLAAFWAAQTQRDDRWVVIVVVVVILLLLASSKKRSRAIPVKSKRLALAKFFQEHYSDSERSRKRLNLKDYEFDHIIPFSRGGTNDPENIKVIPKKDNRRKGAKIPWQR